MNWEELTDSDFAKAVKRTNLCVVPLGVLEKHGPHLPLGTDAIAAHVIATRAAQREEAVVFPPYFFGQITEAKHFPGTFALRAPLLLKLLQAVCDEIGRNGFTKILLYNGHGGNSSMVRYFIQCSLDQQRPYTLYHSEWLADMSLQAQIDKICPTKGGHADETETSVMLSIAKPLVKMDRVGTKTSLPLGRLGPLGGAGSAIWWYANFPEHYAGDARPATAEKGHKVMEIYVASLAEAIRKVKADKTSPALHREFFARVARVGKKTPKKRRRSPGQDIPF